MYVNVILNVSYNMYSPTLFDICTAADRLRGHIYPTPLCRSEVLDKHLGKTLWFKPECQQKVGAFKYRGAFNRLRALTQAQRVRGVVAFSSGNHGQGVARAARELGVSAIVVMPSDAPQVKIDGVRRDQAELVLYDRQHENREQIAARIAREQQRVLVPSFDDPYIIAGQGTIGLEVADRNFDALITPVGGGGLCAGISLSMAERAPQTKIFAAEPVHYNDHQMSLRSGELNVLDNPPASLCDAVMTPQPGALTWPINQRYLSDIFTARDETCLIAMGLLHAHLGLTVEPSGALGLAVLLEGALQAEPHMEHICIVLSGGNVASDILQRALKSSGG